MAESLPIFHGAKIADKIMKGGDLTSDDIYDTMFGSTLWRFVKDLVSYHQNPTLYTGPNTYNRQLVNLYRHTYGTTTLKARRTRPRGWSGRRYSYKGTRYRRFKSRSVYKSYKYQKY